MLAWIPLKAEVAQHLLERAWQQTLIGQEIGTRPQIEVGRRFGISVPRQVESSRRCPGQTGLEELLDFLDACNIPFVIISGGLRGMIDARLGSIVDCVYKIFSADVDTSGEFIKVTSDFEGGMELVAKVDVMNLFGDGRRIVIGDGATDINMARGASLIFARDNLAFFLDHMGISYNE